MNITQKEFMKEKEKMRVRMRICEELVDIYKGYATCNDESKEWEKKRA